MPLKPSYSQEAGVVHGGIISVLADTAAAYAVFPDLEDNETMTGVEFKVNFLRPVVVDDGRLTARSRVVKRGQKIALCEVEVFQRQRIVAKGLFTYLFYRKEPEGDGPPS